MFFKTNECQQLSFEDSFMNLTDRERKALEKSWARIFADEIFPTIDEERFSVLYSDSRFCKRCYDYETLHGVDLYYNCVKDLSSIIAKIMKLNGCVPYKNYLDKVVESLKHYADSNDYNRVFYHQRNDDMEKIIQALLTDSNYLLDICKEDLEEVTEYQLFVRYLSDQTVVENEKRRLRTKEDGTMNSSAIQSPSDPDATYGNKSGKLHRGYAANIEEMVGKNGSVVTDYQFDKNTHTDSLFFRKLFRKWKNPRKK